MLRSEIAVRKMTTMEAHVLILNNSMLKLVYWASKESAAIPVL